ncbi:ATP-dependent DNA ligase, partial [Aureobasidium melanogenum]
KDWKSALNLETFWQLKSRAEHEKKEKEFKVDDARKKRAKRARKKELTVIGADEQIKTPFAGPETALFNGMSFYIITGAAKPLNKTKQELEQLVKVNGGNIVTTHTNTETICIAEGNPIRVASIKKAGTRNIFRPEWLLECIKQAEADVGRPNVLLPLEPRHVLFSKEEDEDSFKSNIDEYGDSFARDVDTEELEKLLSGMPDFKDEDYNADEIMDELFDDDVLEGPGCMFRGLRMYVAGDDASLEAAKRVILFAGARLTDSLKDEEITHVIASDEKQAREMRIQTANRRYPPRVVTVQWIMKSLKEGTRLDEESAFS